MHDCVCVLPCLHHLHVGAHGGHCMASNSLALELQAGVSRHVDAGSCTLVFCKSSRWSQSLSHACSTATRLFQHLQNCHCHIIMKRFCMIEIFQSCFFIQLTRLPGRKKRAWRNQHRTALDEEDRLSSYWAPNPYLYVHSMQAPFQFWCLPTGQRHWWESVPIGRNHRWCLRGGQRFAYEKR